MYSEYCMLFVCFLRRAFSLVIYEKFHLRFFCFIFKREVTKIGC